MNDTIVQKQRALDTLNGMGSKGPLRFVRKATAELFDTTPLTELAEGIDLNDNNRPSSVALGALYAGFLRAKRGFSVQEAAGYVYLGGSLADVVNATDVQGALAALVQSKKDSQAASQAAALASGKAATSAVTAANKRVDKMVEVFANGVVPSEAITALESAKAKIEAALASVSVSA